MATPSPMNFPGFRSGPLSQRPALAVGRPIDDPQRQDERLDRIARQQFGQTGDPRMMMSLDWRNQRPRGFGPPPMGAPGPMQPGGQGMSSSQGLVPVGAGQGMPDPMKMLPEPESQGMVNGQDGQDGQVPGPPRMPFESVNPGLPTSMQPSSMFPATQAALPQLTGLPQRMTPQFNPQAPLPSSTLGGGSGVPPPPDFQMRSIGGSNVLLGPGGKYLNSFKADGPPPQMTLENLPGTPFSVGMLGGSPVPGLPTFQEQANPGWSVKGQPKTEFKPVPDDKGPKVQWEKDAVGRITGGVQQVQNPQTGQWEFRRVKIIDENNDGIDDRQQTGGGATAAGKTVSPFVAAFGS